LQEGLPIEFPTPYCRPDLRVLLSWRRRDQVQDKDSGAEGSLEGNHEFDKRKQLRKEEMKRSGKKKNREGKHTEAGVQGDRRTERERK
jgi:hypothetical protein